MDKIENIYPLSPMQSGMLFESLYHLDSGVNIEQIVIGLPEDIGIPNLEEAWDKVVERHAVLRTGFEWEGLEKPRQVVYETFNLPFINEDWKYLETETQEKMLEKFLIEDRQIGFDLEKPPLLRITLFNLGDKQFKLIWTYHHILIDGRSVPIILKEVFSIYEALCSGLEIVLDDPIPYQKYIDWLEMQDFSAAEGYWQELLSGFSSPTSFGVEKCQPFDARPYGIHKSKTIDLSDRKTSAILSFAEEYQITLNTILQSAWGFVLGRYSAEDDVVFGVVKSNRRSVPEKVAAQSMVGLLINTLPLRVQISQDLSIISWLKSLRSQWISQRKYEHTPLMDIQAWSDCAPGKSLFESLFGFENLPIDDVLRQSGGKWLNRTVVWHEKANFSLMFSGNQYSRLKLTIYYDSNHFDDEIIGRMLGHIEVVLDQFLKNPTEKISSLQLLTEVERNLILVKWNDTTVDFPMAQCVHHLFEDQVYKNPEKIAVIFPGKDNQTENSRQLTYGQLNDQANQIATFLQRLGVGPEVIVGVCLDRSIDFISTILGIIKAGGAYLPIDPVNPVERIEFMLADSAAPLLITQEDIIQDLPQYGGQLIYFDDQEINNLGGVNFKSKFALSPGNLAYVIYSSGSTGKPKGVQVTHYALVNHTLAIQIEFNRGDGDRILQMASFGFDFATGEIFQALCSGGTVILRPENSMSTIDSFLETLQTWAITLIAVPTSVLHWMVDGMVQRNLVLPASVKTIFFGGEEVNPDLLKLLTHRIGPDVVMANGYGPTEAAIVATNYCIPSDFPSENTLSDIPIGKPLSNVAIYILDDFLNPVPVGVAGEIYISGFGLARNYLNLPALTAERFVPDPFGKLPGSMMYKTGDIGSFMEDGNIMFNGRIDQQVKFRGYRVELGEVERVLQNYPGINQAVVIVTRGGTGIEHLSAFIVANSGIDKNIENIRIYLNHSLPVYMVPTYFYFLDALPLNQNDKVDRQMLIKLIPLKPEFSLSNSAPQTITEETIAEIWGKVLGVDQIGANDNFFNLGGHSLLAAQINSEMKNRMGIEIPLKTMFDYPTVRGLAVQIEGMAREKSIPIRLIKSGNEIPLSFAQQRLWFLDQYEKGLSAYNMPSTFWIKGALDESALEKSLVEIIHRHSALRTIFKIHEDQPVQVIEAAVKVPITKIDLQHIKTEDRKAEARRLVDEDAQKPFDLGKGVIRNTLLQLGKEENILMINIHHIASDGWSQKIIWQEITSLYEGYVEGKEPELPELQYQYADYSIWQKEWFSGEIYDEQLKYWRKQLEGSGVIRLPNDRPYPNTQTYNGAVVEFEISREQTGKIREISRENRVTLFMAMLTMFNIFLSRYSGQEDISIGTPIANRNHKWIENLVGFFVNMLVIRTDLTGHPSFIQLLERVRETTLDAYTNQDMPFEKLVSELNIERDISRHPLFQVIFSLEESSGLQLELKGLQVDPYKKELNSAKYELGLHITAKDGGLIGTLTYNTDIFERATIQRMAEHFLAIIGGIVTNPHRPVVYLPLLRKEESQRMLIEWNETRTEYPREKCIHELFEDQVSRTPEKTAIIFENQIISYQELNKSANKAGNYLHKMGIGSEDLVGICMGRSQDMIVNLLGILKAGGAYVPLDPTYPKERLNIIIKDAKISVVITQDQFKEKFIGLDVDLVVTGPENNLYSQESEKPPGVEVSAENLVYAIYTSGSTGRPKGVAIQHRNLVDNITCVNQIIFWQPGLLHPALANFTFDVSVAEIFTPLVSGNTIWIMPDEIRMNPYEFGKLIAAKDQVVLSTGPTFWNAVLEVFEDNKVEIDNKYLKTLILGTEAVDEEIVDRTLAIFPDISLWNLYGPTETTVNATWTRVYKDTLVTIGKPVPNAQAYILDDNMLPQPVGVPGILYIGGNGLARGYRNSPALTAESFVPNPFGGLEGSRLYNSGDLAKWNTDGLIEFLGRKDHQVKIRGFRIELGEIESVISRIQGVKYAVVKVVEGISHSRKLAAFIVPSRESIPATKDIQDEMRNHLPEYMIPSYIEFLDSLPLTSSGKIDRNAIPITNLVNKESQKPFAPPRNQREEIIAGIWERVLEIEQIGVDENFFELGGHSLLAAQAVNQIQRILEVDVPIKTLFEAPTISELGEKIALLSNYKVPPITPANRNEELPLSFAQQRLWFLDKYEPDLSAYNIPSGFRIKGPLAENALEKSLTEIIRRHEVLRTSFPTIGDRPVQIIKSDPILPLMKIDLQNLSGIERDAEIQRLVEAETTRVFDLSQNVLGILLIKLEAEDHILVINIHHIASDGWSQGIFLRELKTLYNTFLKGSKPKLPELTTQYVDYSIWQREWLNGEALEEHLRYWRKHLKGISVLDLPTDRPHPTSQTYDGASVQFEISQRQTRIFKEISRKNGVTLFMAMLSVFNILLARYSGQVDISVGIPTANRDHPWIENLIGFFVNMLVIRTDLSGTPTFDDLLKRVRETILDAFTFQDLPFEKLVSGLNVERDITRTPLFQVIFTFDNESEQPLEFDGLQIERFDMDLKSAKFEMGMFLKYSNDGLTGALNYNTEIFERATIQRMAEHFLAIIDGIVTNPHRPVVYLPLLREEESQRMLIEWNETRTEYPREKCVHEIFEEQVKITPDKIALETENEKLTYQELNDRSNQVAHYLREKGVSPEVMVGICMERSKDLVIGLLGILKAGGAYVPIDPEYPERRIGLMLEETNAKVLITDKKRHDANNEYRGEQVCLASSWEEISQFSVKNPAVDMRAENLAYVIFTSGSTGTPKGNTITHRGVVRLITKPNYAQLTENNVILQFANIAFDASTFEIWGALLNGGLLVMPPGEKLSLGEIGKIIQNHHVTTLWLTAGLFHQMVDTELEKLDGVRQLLAGGDVLSVEHIRKAVKSLDETQIINGYGPTENTTFTTFYPIQKDDDLGTSVPIGKPVSNTRVYVLDTNQMPVPIGVAGEICVGGDGLARSYLNDPKTTAEKYVPDPFSEAGGERLYRTGDIARYRKDGNIEFIGRQDQQFKVRGYRIEMGEIEAVMSSLAVVKEVIVIAENDTHGGKKLIAYIIPEDGQEVTSVEIKDHIRKHLPAYMMPSTFMFVEEFPLTSAGKIDRLSLPNPDINIMDGQESFVAPRTQIEEVLAVILQDVLELDQIGVTDDFFELGGHSLLATQVVARIEDTFKVELSFKKFFENPTIDGIGYFIQSIKEVDRILEEIQKSQDFKE